MKKICCCAFFALVMLMSPGLRASAMSDARVRVNINLPFPPLIFPAPPPLVPIPGAYVYYPPDSNVDIFFYHDRWYRPHDGKWYRAGNYNGPWHFIHGRQVPRAVAGIPPSYRGVAHHYERIPYRQVQRNHWAWEKNHHWDRHERQTYKRFHGEKHAQNNDRHGHHKDDQSGPDYHGPDHHGPDHHNGKNR
jgi:hypothetical protein